MSAVPIDMVVVNLYPFSETIAKSDTTLEMARAHIDIGGPCMVRAAAKNFLRVSSVTDPSDYASILDELRQSGGATSLQLRYKLAQKAFAHTADYDTSIASYLARCEVQSVADCYEVTKVKENSDV